MTAPAPKTGRVPTEAERARLEALARLWSEEAQR